MPTEVTITLVDHKDISQVQNTNSHTQQHIQLYTRQQVPEMQLVERG